MSGVELVLGVTSLCHGLVGKAEKNVRDSRWNLFLFKSYCYLRIDGRHFAFLDVGQCRTMSAVPNRGLQNKPHLLLNLSPSENTEYAF